jgi:hypothetical protein
MFFLLSPTVLNLARRMASSEHVEGRKYFQHRSQESTHVLTVHTNFTDTAINVHRYFNALFYLPVHVIIFDASFISSPVW